jgi:hypothetical protein
MSFNQPAMLFPGHVRRRRFAAIIAGRQNFGRNKQSLQADRLRRDPTRELRSLALSMIAV